MAIECSNRRRIVKLAICHFSVKTATCVSVTRVSCVSICGRNTGPSPTPKSSTAEPDQSWPVRKLPRDPLTNSSDSTPISKESYAKGDMYRNAIRNIQMPAQIFVMPIFVLLIRRRCVLFLRYEGLVLQHILVLAAWWFKIFMII